MSEVISLGKHTQNNTLITPIQALQDIIRDIESGKLDCNKLLILSVKADEQNFKWNFYASNIKVSEMMSLCTLAAHEFAEIINKG